MDMSQLRPAFKLNLWTVSVLLVIFGIFVSGYLSYVKLTDVPMTCAVDSGFDCASVQNSNYSEIMGIPIAWLGLGTYLVIGGLLLMQYRSKFMRQNGMLILFGIVFFAFLYSMYLVYVQGVLIEAWCQWCLMHEANMTVLFIVTILRLRAFLNDPDVVI
ncbi:MAG: vitamin K epoxide reductase family protein [Chloroflexi bacterium]|nr:MAG: vitamin K epoxide reductase family protein [Chloroflexota bacterium]